MNMDDIGFSCDIAHISRYIQIDQPLSRMAQNSLIQIFLIRRKLQREQEKTEQLEQELWYTRQVGMNSRTADGAIPCSKVEETT